MSLSTHVLDSATGTPAAGIAVRLEFRATDAGRSKGAATTDAWLPGGAATTDAWIPEGAATTDAGGRIQSLPTPRDGVYRITFGTGTYYAARGVATFYPEVWVLFTVTDPSEHHHVPLLLSPFAYSTYRGS